MLDQYRTLLEENNVISLRRAVVIDDGSSVGFHLMPAWLGSSIPGSKPKGFDWVSQDFAYLYRHVKSLQEEEKLVRSINSWQQAIRPMRFEKPPIFKLLWADSGNTVALYLNGEPWAFIDEETHKGYSKGILKPVPHITAIRNGWDQELFEKIFKIV